MNTSDYLIPIAIGGLAYCLTDHNVTASLLTLGGTYLYMQYKNNPANKIAAEIKDMKTTRAMSGPATSTSVNSTAQTPTHVSFMPTVDYNF